MPTPYERRPVSFSMFSYSDDISVSRLGKKVMVKGRDGTFQETDSVEANLLFEILKTLRKKQL